MKAKISYELFERVVVEATKFGIQVYVSTVRGLCAVLIILLKQLIILFPYNAIKYDCYFNDDSVEILKVEKSYNWLSECSFLDIQVL